MDPTSVIKHPLLTEKSMDLTDKQNKLTFIIRRTANKNEIRQAVEKMYSVKVISVATGITLKGQKKAYVKLAKEHSASEIAGRMGIL